ncbi:MAG: hypothetical protein CSB48_01270 [Proteobacteria bacterium]|nr:MAG: hypothetical protein CSB48_01270 [Pseudomonadota bacterium]
MRKLVNPKYHKQAMEQLGGDLARRSVVGSIVYFLGWIAVVLPSVSSTTGQSQKTLLMLFTALVVAVSGARVLFIRTYHKKTDSLWPLYAGVFLSGGVWGSISYYMLTTPGFADFSVPLFIATTGLCAGGVFSLAPCRECAIIFLVLLVGPLGAALYSGNVTNSESVIWLSLIYLPGLCVLASLHRKEYFTSLNARFSLEEKSARLAELNTIDHATGLKNHRFFEARLAYEFKRGIREETPVSVLLIDVDHFQRIHKNYGKQIADESIREMARSISSLFNRSVDIVARYGGDKFVILLPGTPYESAKKLAEKIRKKIEQIVIKYEDAEIRFTASIAVNCCIPDSGSSEVELILQTEEALRRAINNGGNQIATCNNGPYDEQEEDMLVEAAAL